MGKYTKILKHILLYTNIIYTIYRPMIFYVSSSSDGGKTYDPSGFLGAVCLLCLFASRFLGDSLSIFFLFRVLDDVDSCDDDGAGEGGGGGGSCGGSGVGPS